MKLTLKNPKAFGIESAEIVQNWATSDVYVNKELRYASLYEKSAKAWFTRKFGKGAKWEESE